MAVSDNVIAFKVYLTGENVRKEVRRFDISYEDAYNFFNLLDKLKQVFPQLQGKNFITCWKDSEGDDIMVSSNDEMKIAVSEHIKAFANRPKATSFDTAVKLYVTVLEDHQHEQPASSPANDVKHVGVVCDGCDKGIVGFRYKCLQCADYDLCSTCESKGMHSEHCMMRTPVPLPSRPHYTRRLAHSVNRFMKKNVPAENHCSKENKEGRESCRRGRQHSGNSSAKAAQNCPWSDIVTSYLSDFAFLPSDILNAEESNQANASKSEESQNDEGCKAGNVNVKGHLKTIGDTISGILEPFGINVEVHVKDEGEPFEAEKQKTPDREQATTPEEKKAQAGKETPKTNGSEKREQPPIDFMKTLSNIVQMLDPIKIDTPSPKETSPTEASAPSQDLTDKFPGVGKKLVDNEKTSEKNSPRGSVSSSGSAQAEKQPILPGWTIVNPLDVSAPDNTPVTSPSNGAVPKQSSPSAPAEEAAKPQSTNLYPELPQSERIFHSDPKISRAVEAMMAMGFTNEGGWLTQVLASNNGDIVKVLDLLQPVNTRKN